MSNIEKNFKREEEYEAARNRKGKIKKSKTKKKILAIISGALAFVSIGGIFIANRSKRKNNNQNDNDIKVVQTSDTLDSNKVALDALDIDLSIPEDKKVSSDKLYTNPTGNVNVNTIKEDSNGTIWTNEEAHTKKDQIGTKIEDKKGTLIVNPTGEVYEKETGYEIKDESGNTIESGEINDGIPAGYVWDSARGEYVKEDEVGKYVYNKLGELVSVDDPSVTNPDILDDNNETKIEEDTSNTINDDETSNEIESPSNNDNYGGTINSDGTYTIYGTTYMDKATFEAFILGDENDFGYLNGIIYPKSYLNEINNELILSK